LTPKRKQKRKTYDDKFRTNAVLMAEALADSKGALAKAAKHMKVPHSTLSRWARGKQNPPPSQLVHEKREELVDRLEDMAHTLLDAMGLDIEANGVDAVRAATAMGITIDKIQLLKGEPTGIIKVVRMIQEGRVKPEQVRAKWPSLADELFVRAGVDVDGT
jgi:transcriptional regulator with XRE-family HTH domain